MSHISWHELFMGIALLSAQRSKDPNTKVGACIVNKDNLVIGIGYNGFVRGCYDDDFPWGREGDWLETKYPYVVHAELNAILNSYGDLKNSTLYTVLFPCNECAKVIVQKGIETVYYLSDKYKDTDSTKAARKIFTLACVETEQLEIDKTLILNYDNQ